MSLCSRCGFLAETFTSGLLTRTHLCYLGMCARSCRARAAKLVIYWIYLCFLVPTLYSLIYTSHRPLMIIRSAEALFYLLTKPFSCAHLSPPIDGTRQAALLGPRPFGPVTNLNVAKCLWNAEFEL